ncbi:hypothetical protein [Maribacter sp.]
MSEEKTFNFPVLDKVVIKNFSLYKKKDIVEINFDKDVFCLAGANGLGKSTFLTILNYGLTGVVLDPSKNFKSVVSTSRFYNLNKKFSENYFTGRISEEDRERASVYLKFKLGNETIELERSFFDMEELKSFKRGDEDFSSLSDSEKHNEYVLTILDKTNLKSFDQFFFIQHFILTFDEHHHLLFWDKSLMETSLYLFIGLNPEKAQDANKLRKKINQLGSNIRNWSDQRNRTVKTVKSLENQLGKVEGEVSDEVLLTYETLDDEINQIKDKIYINERENKQANLNLADYSLKRTEFERKYEAEFSNFMKPDYQNFFDDIRVKDILTEIKTNVCSKKDYSISLEKLIKYIADNHCIKNTDDNVSANLKDLDSEIHNIKSHINSLNKEKERLILNETELKKELNQKQKEIFDLEKQFGETLKQLRSASQKDLAGVLSSYNEQIDKLNQDIDDRKDEREECKKQLQVLEKALYQSFKEAEDDFIPRFKNYVENFLGFEVQIHLRNKSDGSVLVLEINDTERTDVYQLSESQRYFIDIGLRMSMIDYACDSAMFLIDTPEGSLDIAYESKAGQMFANFASNNKLLMTANINSSELLLVLAEKCKNERMKMERMTEWTILSEVQQQEEYKIDKAYETIELKMN